MVQWWGVGGAGGGWGGIGKIQQSPQNFSVSAAFLYNKPINTPIPMNDQIENDKIKADLLGRSMDMNATLISSAASTYAYNKINNLLLMQILAKLENRDLEEIRNNVDKYIAQFTEEFIKMNSQF
jgi:hypothetical protein